MKKLVAFISVALAGVFAASAAHSAGSPMRTGTNSAAAEPWDWTGAYVGIQGGGGWGKAQQTDPFPFLSRWYRLSGGLAGATWGYNWQIGSIVVGFESDAAWASIGGKTDGISGVGGPCGGAPAICEAEVQYLGTARLRLGYAIGRWLPYVTGGMASGYVRAAEGNAGSSPNGSGSEFHFGWTTGGGVEVMIDPHWSAKIEYLYGDLRDGNVFLDSFAGGVAFVTESEAVRVQVVRVGLNYRFSPGPALLPFLPPSPGPGGGPWRWSGLYAGVNFGGATGNAAQSDAVFDRGSYNVGGSVIGGTAGYNWQMNSFVYGLEGDFDYSWIKGATGGLVAFGSLPCGGTGLYAYCDTKLQWLGTARARAGVAWDRLLVYGTGGVAVGSLESSEGSPAAGPIFGSGTVTRAGWTAGGGIEARIDNHWSAKLEYLYVDLGGGRGFTDTYPGAMVNENVSFHAHLLRGGFNYLFN